MTEEKFKLWKPPKIRDGKPTKWGWIVRHKAKFRLGRNTDLGAFTYINAKHGVSIGDGVQIGSHCSIYSSSTMDNKNAPVWIGKDVRIGSHCTIMPGVVIGALIGAHRFVNSNIASLSVAMGVTEKYKG